MYFNRKDKNETYFASGSVSSFCSEGHDGVNAHMYFHKTASWHDVPRTEFPEDEQEFFKRDENAIIFTCENYRGVSYDVIVFPFVLPGFLSGLQEWNSGYAAGSIPKEKAED